MMHLSLIRGYYLLWQYNSAIGPKGVVLSWSSIMVPHCPRYQSGSHLCWDVKVTTTCTGINCQSLRTRPVAFGVLLLLMFLPEASFSLCLERWWLEGFRPPKGLVSVGSPEPKNSREAFDFIPLVLSMGWDISPNNELESLEPVHDLASPVTKIIF